jgi:hypothetical protein
MFGRSTFARCASAGELAHPARLERATSAFGELMAALYSLEVCDICLRMLRCILGMK